jgi:serine/threonine protein kinase
MKASFSADAQSLLSQLLVTDPSKRLGSGVSDANEIKKHPFFRNVNWGDCEILALAPPFIPNVTSEIDTQYFDKVLSMLLRIWLMLYLITAFWCVIRMMSLIYLALATIFNKLMIITKNIEKNIL